MLWSVEMSVVVIWCSNLARSAEFYQAVLEGERAHESNEFVSVSAAGNEVLLHLLPEQYRDEPSYGAENPIKPVFEVASLSNAAEAAMATGGSIPGEQAIYGDWEYLDAIDPDGHVIQFRQRI